MVRDLERQDQEASAVLKEQIHLAKRLLEQERDSLHKLYSIHEPQAQCIAKGKAHQRYEFGCKVGFVVSTKGNWILAAQAFVGNPYAGHTLQSNLDQATRLTATQIKKVGCALGYRRHGVTNTFVSLVPRRKNRASRAIRRWWKRRNAIEPIIGQQKNAHRLNRHQLSGELGDQLKVIFSACGFNIKKLMRAFCLRWQQAFDSLPPDHCQRMFA